MSLRLLTLCLLSAAAVIAAVPATLAADLDEPYGYGDAPPPVAETKVEFGTGWYVRGDLGATAVPRLGVTVPVASYTPVLATDGDRKLAYTASLGGGYSFNRWFRADLIFDYNEPKTSSFDGAAACPGGSAGSCVGSFRGAVQNYDVLVNGYFDLGTWYNVTPYIGAGVGLGFGHTSVSSSFVSYDGNGSNPIYVGYHQNYYNFAYALMVGASFGIFDHTRLDISYRYLDLGRVQVARLDAHQIRAGLRYMIDN